MAVLKGKEIWQLSESTTTTLNFSEPLHSTPLAIRIEYSACPSQSMMSSDVSKSSSDIIL